MKKSTFALCSFLCLSTFRVGMAQPKPPLYKEAITQGKQNLGAKNYEAAEKNAIDSLELAASTKQTGNALILLGETFYQRKMYEQARTQWNKAAALSADDPDSRVYLGSHSFLAKSYLAEDNFDKALSESKFLTENVDLDPTSRAAFLMWAADVQVKAQQFAPAREQLSQALELIQKDEPFEGQTDLSSVISVRLGTAYVLEKNYAKAMEVFNQVVNTKDVNSVIIEDAQSQVDLLLPLLASEKKIRRLNNTFDTATDAQIKLGQKYVLDKDYEKALAQFNTILNSEKSTPNVKAQAQTQVNLLNQFALLEEKAQNSSKKGESEATITYDYTKEDDE